MASVAIVNEDKSFSIGTVLSRAFGVMGDNPAVVFGISFLFGALPQILYTYFAMAGLQAAGPGTELATGLLSFSSGIVAMLAGALVQAAIVRATMAYSEGERASFGASLATGVTKALPMLALTILLILGMMVGFVLFIIPGVILMVMWVVAQSALVGENAGVFGSFGRSRFLTKGARWKIFGLLLLLLVLFWILSIIASTLMAAFGFASMMTALSAGQPPTSYYVLSAVTGTLWSALWATVQTSLYVSLREWKDGPGDEALADVFA